MNNKQVLAFILLKSTNDLKSIFVGHIHFKKLTKCQKFIEIFHYCLTRLRNKKQGFFWLYLLIRTTLRKEQDNIILRNILNSAILMKYFLCGMNRLKNTNSSVFIQCQHIRTILRNENVEQSLFKKHSKFQKFDEINCRMTRFRNVKLDVFR